MSDGKNEIMEVSLDSPSQEIPLEEDVTLKALKEFRAWIKDHPEYPQRISKSFCFYHINQHTQNLI